MKFWRVPDRNFSRNVICKMTFWVLQLEIFFVPFSKKLCDSPMKGQVQSSLQISRPACIPAGTGLFHLLPFLDLTYLSRIIEILYLFVLYCFLCYTSGRSFYVQQVKLVSRMLLNFSFFVKIFGSKTLLIPSSNILMYPMLCHTTK